MPPNHYGEGEIETDISMNLLEHLELTRSYHFVRKRTNEQIVTFLRKMVGHSLRRAVVLEIACGTGVGSALLGTEEWVELSVAADLNTELLLSPGARGEKTSNFVITDLYRAGLKGQSFDIVWNNSSFEHFDTPETALIEMKKLAKPNGYIFVGVPYALGPLSAYYVCPLRSWRKWIGRPFTRKQLEASLVSAKIIPVKSIIFSTGCFVGVLGRVES